MKKLSAISVVVMLALNVFTVSAQQLKVPAPSPAQTLKQSLGLGEVTIEYSRPSVKGRVIFGDLVPYGKVWRTGANATTKITFSEDVKIEGTAVPAGTYGLYTIPNVSSWDIMLYKDLTLGGNVSEYKMENEVLRFRAKPSLIMYKTESFTIDMADITATTAKIELLWDKTKVSFNISTEIDAKVMKNIETSLAPPVDKRPYFQAASYYYENDKDLTQALDWTNKAFEQNPKAYWIAHLKAKIQVKQKDYVGAIASAEQSKALATEDKNDDYVKMNDKLIADAKKAGKIK